MAERNTRLHGRQLADSIAGNGLKKNSSTNALELNLKTSAGLNIDTDQLEVLLESAKGLVVGASGLAVDFDDSSIGIVGGDLAIKALGITNAMLAGSIADGKMASDYVQTSEVDDSSIEFGSSLNVKALGITNAMLAGSIADGKMASDYVQTSEVDDSSIEFGSSLNVKALGITNAMLAGSIAFSKMVDLTASRALVSDGSGDVSVSAVTATELGYVSGVTSGIQSQLNAVISGYVRQPAVIDVADNTAVPPTEVSGDRYILDETGGGVHANWDGASANDIVTFNGTSWVAVTPDEGFVAYVDAQNKDALFIDDGTPQWELRAVQSTSLADGKIWLGNGSGEATEVTPSGDVTISNSGVTTIGATKVTDAMLAQNYIQTSEVDDSTIEFDSGTLNIKALGVDTAQLAGEAVSEGKMDIYNAPSIGKFLKYTSNGLEWSDAGVGDMLKSVYDTGDNGAVDKADTVTVAGSVLGITDATNPKLAFTDKNAKVFGLSKTTDVGDLKKWVLDIEGNDTTLFYDVGNGWIGFDSAFEITGKLYTRELFVGTGSGGSSLEIKLHADQVGLDAYGQGNYIDLNSDGSVDINGDLTIGNIQASSDNSIDLGATGVRFKDLYLAGNLTDDTYSVTIANIKSAVDDAHDHADNETPSGLINSANVTYTLANTPTAGTVKLFLNGLRQEAGSGKDFTISGGTITYTVAPESGDVLLVDYQY